MNLHDLIWHNGKFLGIDWSIWKGIGFAGTAVFFSRFFVQWYASEKKGQVVVPAVFWWLSLVGTLLLLSYAIHKMDSVFIVSYLLSWVPYLRNLVLHYRYEKAHSNCVDCGYRVPPKSNFCPHCGAKLQTTASARS
jgi:lipid-A-disaccharide synthase-like uncharacterized protein